MPCNDCIKYKKNENIDYDQCLFHVAKDVIQKNNLDNIKKWVDSLEPIDNQYGYNHTKTEHSFHNLVNYIIPRLLRQKAIHKKFDKKKLSKLLNYILSKAKEENIYFFNVRKTYLQYGDIDLVNICRYLTETDLLLCIRQGISLEESLRYCYSTSNTKRYDINEIVNYYRKRDILLFRNLYQLPTSIVEIIIYMMG